MTDASARRAPFDPVERETWEERVRRDLSGDLSALAQRLLGDVEVGPLYTERRDQAGEPAAPPFIRGSVAPTGFAVAHALRGDEPESLRASAHAAQSGGAERLWLPWSCVAGLPDEAALVEALDGVELPIDVEVDPLGLAWTGAFARRGDLHAHCDAFAHLAAGRLGVPLEIATRLVAELVALGEPEDRPALVDARVHHEAGAHVPMELGAAIATGVDLLRRLTVHEHPLADAPRRIRFALSVGSDLFVEIAKLRAARLLWSKALRAIGIDGAEQGMRVHAFASRRERAALGHHNNLLRETAVALAAAVGGADRITLEPYERSAHGERLSRNTLLLLRHESHVSRVQDAAGGSYYVEALTDQLARAGWSWLQQIEAQGGMGDALSTGWWAEQIGEASAERRAALGRAQLVRVGVNRYPAAPSAPPAHDLSTVSPALGSRRAPKALRDALKEPALGRWATALSASRAPVADLRAELARLGEPEPATPLRPWRDAEAFEELRVRAEGRSVSASVVGAGAAAALRAKVIAATETLSYLGLDAGVHLGATVEEAVAFPTAAVVIAVAEQDDNLAALVEALVNQGAGRVVGLRDDADRLALASKLLDALEAES